MTLSNAITNVCRNAIQNTQLPTLSPGPQRPRFLLAGESEQALQNDNAITSFVDGVREEFKDDVLKSTLWVQLAADVDFDRFRESEQWLGRYRQRLGIVGWNVPASNRQEVLLSGSTVEVSEVLLGVIKDLAELTGGFRLLEVATKAFGVNRIPDNDQTLDVLDTRQHVESRGIAMSFPCEMAGSNVVMLAAGTETQVVNRESRFLWFRWSKSSTKIFRTAFVAELNTEFYKELREDVDNALGNRARDLINNLELP